MNFSLRRRISFVIGVGVFSKQWGVCSFIILCPSLISCYMHEDGQYRESAWPGCHHMHSKSQKNTRSNNQSEQTYGILQGYMIGTGRKHEQNKFNR